MPYRLLNRPAPRLVSVLCRVVLAFKGSRARGKRQFPIPPLQPPERKRKRRIIIGSPDRPVSYLNLNFASFSSSSQEYQKHHDSRTASHDPGRSIWPSDSTRCQPCIPSQAAFYTLARSSAPFKEATPAFPVPPQQVHRPPFFKT